MCNFFSSLLWPRKGIAVSCTTEHGYEGSGIEAAEVLLIMEVDAASF
jgi:hypothetical protein